VTTSAWQTKDSSEDLVDGWKVADVSCVLKDLQELTQAPTALHSVTQAEATSKKQGSIDLSPVAGICNFHDTPKLGHHAPDLQVGSGSATKQCQIRKHCVM
jgi:hypothetical protein